MDYFFYFIRKNNHLNNHYCLRENQIGNLLFYNFTRQAADKLFFFVFDFLLDLSKYTVSHF